MQDLGRSLQGFVPAGSLGMGHILGYDTPGGAQPGNVSIGACASTCRADLRCDGFTWYAKPRWSATSECYLKSEVCFGEQLADSGGTRALTYVREGTEQWNCRKAAACPGGGARRRRRVAEEQGGRDAPHTRHAQFGQDLAVLALLGCRREGSCRRHTQCTLPTPCTFPR